MTTDTLRPDSDSGQEIITRAEAKARGLKRYFTGTVCKYGHISERHVGKGQCIECHRLNYRESMEERRAYAKQYYVDNRARIIASTKEYAEKNKDKVLVKAKEYYLNNKEAFADKARSYRQANSAALSEAHREYYKRNKSAILQKIKEYAQKNRDKTRANGKRWKLLNRDKVLENNRKYRERHPERGASHVRNRRARLLQVGGCHTAADIERIYGEQRGRCAWCRSKVKFGEHHVDHIVPLAKGGSNDPANLAIACRPCNQSKAAKDPLDFARQLGRLL